MSESRTVIAVRHKMCDMSFGVLWLERLWQDLRHGARMFVKNPGFTAIAVISIAFGTGGNVAIFSAADALLLACIARAAAGR